MYILFYIHIYIVLIWLTYTTAIVYKTRDRGKTKKEMANTVNETINTNNDKVAFNNINDASNLDPEEYYDKMANEYNNVVVEKWGYKMPQEVTKCLLTNNVSKDSLLKLPGVLSLSIAVEPHINPVPPIPPPNATPNAYFKNLTTGFFIPLSYGLLFFNFIFS